jgi:hypothetical protein
LRDFTERGNAIEGGRYTVDHLDRILSLAGNDPGQIAAYLAENRLDAERVRLVAQALSRPGLDAPALRTAEANACKRPLGAWRHLIEDNLMTLV